jgi:hypothetical protein
MSSIPLPTSRFDLLFSEIGRIQKGERPGTQFGTDYIASAASDYTPLVKTLSARSKFDNPKYQPTSALSLHTSDSLTFDAYAQMEPDGTSTTFVVSLGLLFAIEDLFIRACCNHSFFSFDFRSYEEIWPGCDCLWLRGGFSVPYTRFYDYRQQVLSPLGGEDAEGPYLASQLSGFFTGIPFDNVRWHLSQILTKIALTYVLVHEEAHYWEGHLHFMNKTHGLLRMSEAAGHGIPGDAELLKLLEWQADRHAARGALDVWFRPKMLPALPGIYGGSREWLLRLIMTAVASVTLIFHKVQSIYGSSTKYPQPRSRAITTMRYCLEKFQCREEELMPGMTPLPQEAQVLALAGTLRDLGVVSELLFSEHDLADPEVGNGNLPRSPDGFTLFDDFGEIGDVVKAIFDPSMLEIDGRRMQEGPSTSNTTVWDKWMMEEHQFLFAQETAFDTLRPYRAATIASGQDWDRD